MDCHRNPLPLPKVSEFFPGDEPRRFKIHDLRSTYAKYVETMFTSPHAYPFLAMQVLGHSDIDDSLSYSSIILENAHTLRGKNGPLDPWVWKWLALYCTETTEKWRYVRDIFRDLVRDITRVVVGGEGWNLLNMAVCLWPDLVCIPVWSAKYLGKIGQIRMSEAADIIHVGVTTSRATLHLQKR